MIDPNANRLPWERLPQQQAAVAVERIGQGAAAHLYRPHRHARPLHGRLRCLR